MSRRVLLSSALLGLGALLISGCAGAEPAPTASEQCAEAFDTASENMNQHYDTHPFFGSAYDDLYADGEITAEEQVELDALMADEEAQYAAAIDPIFDACSGWEDLYAGAFAHKDEADWALQESEHVSRNEAREGFVVGFCFDNTDRPACSDFNEDDWR